LKNILFVATQAQRFLDQLFLANNIKKKGEGISIFFFISDEVYDFYRSEVDNLNFIVINTVKKKITFKKKINIKELVRRYINKNQKKILKKYLNRLKNTKFFTNRYKKQEAEYLRDLNKKYNQTSILVLKNKISIIFLNGDRHLGYEPVFLKVSKKLNIPSIVAYLVDYSDEERIFHNDVEIKKTKSNFFTSSYVLNSQKKLKYKVVRGSYYYPHYIGNALTKFGVITLNPYVMGSGASDVLCLNNQYYKDLYINNGVDKHKIKLIGDVSYDRLFEKFKDKTGVKQKVIDKYSLDDRKKICIVGLPQLGEHNILPWNKHWEEINFLISSINSLKQNILISLHPKMDKSKYQFLSDKYNCKILDERLVDVMPIADMFTATFSSTVAWSVLCGIKTLVVDFYDLNYHMYDFLTSIKIVNNKNNLIDDLSDILYKDVDFKEDWASLSRDKVFDGGTTQRYIDLIENMKKE
jgi:hypothetical protein